MQLPKPFVARVPMVNRSGKKTMVDHFMIAPNELIHSLYSKFMHQFRNLFGTRPQDFWAKVPRDDPKYTHLQRQMQDEPGWEERTFPYVLHGDGARFTNKGGESMLSVQFKSLLAGPFEHAILPIFCCPKSCRDGEETLRVLWTYCIGFLNACFHGKHPMEDPVTGAPWPASSAMSTLAGTDICGGSRFVCWAVTGDLEFFGNELCLPKTGNDDFCWMCSATQAHHATCCPMTDLSRGAEWKRTLVDPNEGCFNPPTAHPIAQLVNFTRFHATAELMHTGCLGVLGYFLGSVLWELLYTGPFTGTMDTRCAAILALMKKHYAMCNSSTRLHKLKPDMFVRKKRFSTLIVKAAECQELLFIMPGLLREIHDESPHHEHRFRACNALVTIYRCFKDGEMFLPRADALMALDKVEEFYEHYSWLLHRAVSRNEPNYNITPKFHWLWHIAYMARFLNPRFTWCYEFEDFMMT
eukprot:5374491-Lingulodinium_polyedra.AAC.1